ncbi:hypothetical protein HK405_007371 [Cladochytrium tenue]|nr:hypothetical protein HK405_007371 [Cladochytrium tenue]
MPINIAAGPTSDNHGGRMSPDSARPNAPTSERGKATPPSAGAAQAAVVDAGGLDTATAANVDRGESADTSVAVAAAAKAAKSKAIAEARASATAEADEGTGETAALRIRVHDAARRRDNQRGTRFPDNRVPPDVVLQRVREYADVERLLSVVNYFTTCLWCGRVLTPDRTVSGFCHRKERRCRAQYSAARSSIGGLAAVSPRLREERSYLGRTWRKTQ